MMIMLDLFLTEDNGMIIRFYCANEKNRQVANFKQVQHKLKKCCEDCDFQCCEYDDRSARQTVYCTKYDSYNESFGDCHWWWKNKSLGTIIKE